MSPVNVDGPSAPISQATTDAPASASSDGLTNAQRRKLKKAKKQKAPEAPKPAAEPPVSYGEQLRRAMTHAPGPEVAPPRAREASIAALVVPNAPHKRLPPIPVRVEGWLTDHSAAYRHAVEEAHSKPVYPGGHREVTGIMESLIVEHGHACHIGFFDNSYDVYVQKDKKALVAFKVDTAHKVAVTMGEPLCAPEDLISSFDHFREYCKSQGMHVAVIDASEALAKYARSQKWEVMEFGREQCVNPMTTPLLGSGGNKILKAIKSLNNKGVKFEAYNPADGKNPDLEAQIRAGYDAWSKSKSGSEQTAYATYLDVFKSAYAAEFFYAKKDGKVLGFAGVAKIKGGVVLDPCIAFPPEPGATKYSGITDMLTYSVIAWLKEKKVTSLSFGLEPLAELGEVSGMPKAAEYVTRHAQRAISAKIGLDGKRAYHDKFCPDPALEEKLYIIVPKGTMPPIKESLSILNVTHTQAAAKAVAKDYVKKAKDELVDHLPFKHARSRVHSVLEHAQGVHSARAGRGASPPATESNSSNEHLGSDAATPAEASGK